LAVKGNLSPALSLRVDGPVVWFGLVHSSKIVSSAAGYSIFGASGRDERVVGREEILQQLVAD